MGWGRSLRCKLTRDERASSAEAVMANISLQATVCKLRLQVPSRLYRSAAPELNRWAS